MEEMGVTSGQDGELTVLRGVRELKRREEEAASGGRPAHIELLTRY